MLTDPAIQQVIADAKAAGHQAIVDARDAAHTMLTHLASETEAAVPHLEQAAIAVVVDFVPSSMRTYLQPLLVAATAGTQASVAAEARAGIVKALGIALQRIDGALGIPAAK